MRCLRRGKKLCTDASDCGGSSRVRSDGIRVHNVIPGPNSGYLLRFTCTGDVRPAYLGGDPPGQVRLFCLTCTPKRPQKPSRSASAGKVNCRKPSADEDFVDVAGGGVEVDANAPLAGAVFGLRIEAH